jgi:translation elongation factor EF-4
VYLYEAATIDGARPWQKLRHVTIPMMTPVIFFNLVMGVIGAFQYFTQAYVMTPNDYIGELMKLVAEKRGELVNTETLDAGRVLLTAILPLNEILVDFNDRLKSMTRGYGSMDYE